MTHYYLIINENINSGLINSQVLNPIKNLKNKKIKILNIHKLGVKNKVFENSLNLPISIPYRFFLFNFLFLLTPVLAFKYALILSFFVRKTDRVIARSYFPSLVAYFLHKIKSIEFVFDARSLFIEENTLNGNIKENSLNFKMWKFFEKKILENSFKSIAVSLKQKEFYEKISCKSKVELVPCYVSPVKLLSKKAKNQKLTELGYSGSDIIIGYYGSLDNGWNNIDLYVSFFKKCSDNGYKVLIISQNSKSLIKDDRLKIKNLKILDTSNLTFFQTMEYLQICDYGVVLMKKEADWETRLSVKFVDYLNLGLQVIVGEFVGEAVRYSNQYFSDSTIVYRNGDDISGLKKKTNNYKDIVAVFFGLQNFKKLIQV